MSQKPSDRKPSYLGSLKKTGFNRDGFKKAKLPERAQSGAPPKNAETVYLYGVHTVTAALQNPARTHIQLFATENGVNRLAADGVEIPCPIVNSTVRKLDAMLTPDAVHQGLVLECKPIEFKDFSEFSANSTVLVLDQVTDPHNIGAIFRTAAAFNIDAIITTHRFSPVETGVLAKSASGALEYVPWIRVTNLSSTVEELQKQGFMCVGLDSEAPEDLANTQLKAPLALVLGAEGKGLRQKTRETCNVLARLDLPGKLKSLNVSNAAVLAIERAFTSLGTRK